MGKHGFEASVLNASNDKTDDAKSQLSADQWRPVYADAANRAMHGTNDDNGASTVFNIAKMVPTTFAAFAGNSRADYGSIGQSRGLGLPERTLGGLAVLVGAEYLIDKAFFNDQPIRGGSLAFDFVAPAAMMMAPIAMRYKVAASLASHVAGKLIDKYAP